MGVMSELERLGFIVLLAKDAREKMPWLGHTHFQKLVYLLQAGKGIPLGYNFKMHYYGPYSEALRGDLDQLVSWEILKREAFISNAGHSGYNISAIEDKAMEFLDHRTVREQLEPYKETVTQFLESFTDKEPRDLERLGTTCFVYDLLSPAYKKRKEEDVIKLVIKKVRQLKPQFSDQDVSNAFDELKQAGLLHNQYS